MGKMKFTVGTVLFCCFGFAMKLVEREDFRFEPNQLDFDHYVECCNVKPEKWKHQGKPFKFGLSDALLSEPTEKHALTAEMQDSLRDFDCEIQFVQNEFEALNANARKFVPKKEQNEKNVELNADAVSFSSRTIKYPTDQKTPQETAMKNDNLYMYHNIKYTNNWRVWQKKEDLDVLFELIADEWTPYYRYAANKKIVEETRLEYSRCSDMREKNNTILESMRFFDQTKFRRKIFQVLRRYCHELHKFNSWNWDVFQVAATKIGINIENPVAVLLLKNMNDQGSFIEAIRRVYEKSKNLSDAMRTLQEIAPLTQKDEENIRQHLLRVKPLFLTNYDN